MRSIRKRVLLWLLPATLAALAVTALDAVVQSYRTVATLFDHNLKHTALTLREQAGLSPGLTHEVERELGENIEQAQIVLQISDRAQGVSASAANIDLPFATSTGHHDITWRGQSWRAFTLVLPQRTIQASQPRAARDAAAARLVVDKMIPFALLGVALVVIAWFAVGHGLRPLADLTREIQSRQPRALEPLATHGLPPDLRPTVDALNALLQRLNLAHSAQEAFVADAAHELRSPLTALRLQLQLLERASDERVRGEALADLRAGLARMGSTIEQLLTLARWDPAAPRKLEKVDLAKIAKAVVGEHSNIAEARNIDLGVGVSEEQSFDGEPEAVFTLVASLVDNAVRYTPDGGRVDVNVHHRGENALLEVIDTGPGIQSQERERVFDRFYRGDASSVPGTGLGLAIVKRIAERHGANVQLGAGVEGKGLRVAVEFPLSA